MSTERLTSNKAFTNKLWNAGKFVLQNLPPQSDLSAWKAIEDYKVLRSLDFSQQTLLIDLGTYFHFELLTSGNF